MRFWGGARALGFSLVEIAIVLVVVGLIISGGLLGLSPVLQANKASQTNQQLDRIEQALILYTIQYGCLPCPADPRSVPAGSATIANAGQSRDANGFYTTNCAAAAASTCTNAHGLVPWVNLGLSKNDVLDGYGYFIDYAVTTPSLTQLNTSMARIPPSSYPAGLLTVNNIGGTAQTTAAAYVLISHGADGSFAFTGSTNAGAAGTAAQKADPNAGARQASNAAGGGPGGPFTASAGYFQDNAESTAAANGYFDDILRFKTAPVVIQSCGSNACGNPA